MMSDRERLDFVIWASPLFPNFTTNYQANQQALAAWAKEKARRSNYVR